jgi:hypothetical protein
MRQVDQLFTKRAPGTLYHYTGINSLLSIGKNRTLWASHAYYMNDSREILHACDVLGTILAGEESNFRDEEREFVKQCRDWIKTFRQDAFHIYIFALSEKRSLLSQWRSYTPHGKGVSLGFSPSTLNHILKKPGYKLARCVYEKAEHVDLLRSLLDKMLVTFRQRVRSLDTSKHHQTQKYHGFLEEFRGQVLQVLAIVKHSAFHEEREWRIVSPYFPRYTDPQVKFREGASMLLPYVELSLPKKGWLFDEVILGPSSDAFLSLQALSAYLSNRDVCNVVVNSEIPLREWRK